MTLFLRLIHFITVFALLVCGLLASLPFIINTEWGKEKLLYVLNQKIPGSLHIESLHLSWLGKQHITGFHLKDPEGQSVFQFKTLESEINFWKLLTQSMELGKSRLEELQVAIHIDQDGVSTLQKALRRHPTKEDLPPTTLLLSHVNADLIFDPTHSPLTISLRGLSGQNELNGSFEVEVVLGKFLADSWEELSQQTKNWFTLEGSKEARVHADIKNFPVTLIDQFLSLQHPLHTLIGEHIDLIAEKQMSTQGLVFNMQLSSPKLKGALTGLLDQGTITLVEPAYFSLKMDPLLIDESDEEIVVNLILNDLALPLDLLGNRPITPFQYSFNAQLNLLPTTIQGFKINQLKALIDSPASESVIQLTFMGKAEKENSPYDLFFTLQVPKPIHLKEFERLIQNTWTGGLITSTPFGTIQLSDITLGAPAKAIQLAATLSLLDQKGSFSPLLPEAMPFKLTLEKPETFHLTLEGESLKGKIEGVWSKGSLTLSSDAHLTYFNDRVSKLALRLNIQNQKGHFNPQEAKIELNANLYGLPTSLLSTWIASRDLTPFIGPLLDVELKTGLDMSAESEGYWDMFVDSSQVSAKGRFKISDSLSLYQSNKPTAQIRWTVTPEAFAYLQSLTQEKTLPKLTLSHSVNLTAYLDELDLPLKGKFHTHAKVKGAFESSEMSWKELNIVPPLSLHGSLKSEDISEQIHFTFDGTSKDSSAQLKGTIHQLFDSQGLVRKLEELSTKANLEIKQLPLELLQALLLINNNAKKQLTGLLGPTLDGSASLEMSHLQGPLKLNFSGMHGSAKLDGKVQDGLLKLNAPFEWKVQFNPHLSQAFPVLKDLMSVEQPFKLTIQPGQFAISLAPFDLKKVSVAEGCLEMGQVVMKNSGNLKKIVSLVHSFSDKSLGVWFTPLYFSINQGQLDLKRLDLQVAHQYTLAIWGTVDLISTKFDLVAGLTAQTLQAAFNIPRLGDNYLLQIPLKGKESKLEIDTAKATARITALVAQSHNNSNVQLLGSLVDMALSPGDAPKPTTTPFPWENQSKPRLEDNKKSKKKEERSDLIHKGASQLLKSLLK